VPKPRFLQTQHTKAFFCSNRFCWDSLGLSLRFFGFFILILYGLLELYISNSINAQLGASHFGESIESRGVERATEVIASERKHEIDIFWIPLRPGQLKPLVNLLDR
jgi:hypothetical protein